MKKLILASFSLTIAMMSFTAHAKNQRTLWLAKLTDERQCERILTRNSLGEALSDLERQNQLQVEQALISKMTDQAFCSSCDCPAGNFFVAQVTTEEKIDGEISGGWTPVDPRKIRKLQVPTMNEPVYETQPVFPNR
jgi:hypothetical protein